MNKHWLWTLAALPLVLVAPVALVGIAVVAIISGGAQEADEEGAFGCWTDAPSAQVNVDADAAQLGDVAGYSGEQLQIAKIILTVGAERDVPMRGQTIAVMTGMGESGLRNIDYGDDIHGVRNPDGTLTSSLGVFQQQKWYGTKAQRLDPAYATGKFYDDLLGVEAWPTLEPTIAAHKAQRNADPYHYERYWQSATEVVAALTDGAQMPGAAIKSVTSPCAGPGEAIEAGPDGWVSPVQATVTSRYGYRGAPTAGASSFHKGYDLAASCRTPMHAAAAGTVTYAGLTGYAGGNAILIDHGAGIVTRYAHILSGTFQVSAGDTVTAGQQIASVGGDQSIDPAGAGTSTGCHLHFEVQRDGQAIDPGPFMTGRGVTLGQ